MTHTSGANPSFFLLWGVHSLAMIVLAVGLIFLVIWAIKHLTEAQMKTWGIGLTATGVIVCLLTAVVGGGPRMNAGAQKCGMDMENMPMMQMMKHDGENPMMDHDDMDMGMDMSMKDMSAMLDGKTDDAFDAAFLEGMIPHHQGAIDMARLAQKSAKHDEIKQMANDIIVAQQREIDQMRQWQQAWGYTR